GAVPVVQLEVRVPRAGLRGRGYVGLFLGDEVPPDFPVGDLDLGRYHQIRIDVIAGMDEEVRPVAQHGRIGAHAAARLVDAPALAGLIARPAERNRTAVARRGAKAAHHRLADDGRACKVLKPDAVEDVLAGRELLEQQLGVKSLSGRASTKAPPRISLKLSVVAISICILAGRSLRAQTTPESTP